MNRLILVWAVAATTLPFPLLPVPEADAQARGRVNIKRRMGERFPTFGIVTQYRYPSTTADRVPLCTDDPRCVAVCGIGVVTGSLTATECKGHNGLAIGSVSDPGGTVINSFIPGVKARGTSFAVADSPVFTSSVVDALFASGHSYTVVMGGFAKTNGSGYYYWLSRVGGTSGDFNLYSIGTQTRCSGTNGEVVIAGAPLEAYGFLACRYDGTTYRTTYQYLTASAVLAPEPSIMGTGGWVIGNRVAQDLGKGGAGVFVAWYNDALTNVELLALDDKYGGGYNVAGSLTYGTSQAIAIDNTAVTGNVDMIDATNMLVSSQGLVATRGFTNLAQAGSTLGAAGTDFGTPTVTPGVYSGPYAAWLGSSECALVVDNDATAFEGRTGLTHGTALGFQNASVFALTGTSGTTTDELRIFWEAPGGTATPDHCDFTLTSTPTRFPCVTQITGSPTSIKATWQVGHTVAKTGSIRICQFQPTIGAMLESPQPTSAAISAVHYVVDPAAWPAVASAVGTGTKYEFVQTAMYDPLTQWTSPLDTNYAFDPNVISGPHAGTFIYSYIAAGVLYAQGILTPAIGMTPQQAYATSLEWRAVGGGKCNFVVRFDSCGVIVPASNCHAYTVINQDLTGTIDCLQQPNSCTLALRDDGSAFPTTTVVNAVNISTLSP